MEPIGQGLWACLAVFLAYSFGFFYYTTKKIQKLSPIWLIKKGDDFEKF